MKSISHIPSPSSPLFTLCPPTVLPPYMLCLFYSLDFCYWYLSRCSISLHCGCTLLWPIQPLPLLSLTPLPHLRHFSTAFSTRPYILDLHRCYVLWYYWGCGILLSLPSFPEFRRAGLLLQTHSTYTLVCGHVWFLCMFTFWIYLPHMGENMRA
jgi:hypothetical protein